MYMKLSKLLIDIIDERINEAITYSDLKNFGANIKQGITNIGNKPMDIDFSNTKGGLGRGKLATKRIEDLSREIGFEIPQAEKYNLLSGKYQTKVLGPFNSANVIPNFNYLRVNNIDMQTLMSIKDYFGGDFIIDRDNGSISIKNFKKYKSGNEFIYIYDRNIKGLIIYYSKQNNTNFYLSNTLDPTPVGDSLSQNDINLLERLLHLSENETINKNEFKKLGITIR